jgi:hypothetical protein
VSEQEYKDHEQAVAEFMRIKAQQMAERVNVALADKFNEYVYGGIPADGGAEQFDRLTRLGFHLDMVVGIYRRNKQQESKVKAT